MEFFIGFFIGVGIGLFIFHRIIALRVKNIIQKVDEAYEKKEQENIVPIKFERINKQWYVYNREDDMFLTQGDTYDDIIEDLKKRYPDITFTCSKSALKEIQNI